METNNKNSINGFGIDFGTTNSVVSIYDKSNNKSSPLKRDGKPHPSVVWLRADDSIIVGEEAKRNINGFSDIAGNKIISSIKRHLGKDKTFHIFGQSYKATDIASEIFKFLIADARNNYQEVVKDGIVTIPVSFDGKARRELRKAADKAGFYIKSFVHEPFAALVGFCYRNGSTESLENLEGKNILVFDWGGGTLDITVAAIKDGLISELSTSGLSERAGDDFDEKLLNLTFRRSLESKKLSIAEYRLASNVKDRYLKECEDAKIRLSSSEEESVNVPKAFEIENQLYPINETIIRSDFESIIQIDVNDAMNQVEFALKAAGLSKNEIDRALLIGGTSNIPIVWQELNDYFGGNLKEVQNADTIIAEGAAIVDSLGLHPVFAKSIGIQLSHGIKDPEDSDEDSEDSYFEVFPAGMLAKGSAAKQINLYCTDNRDGEARLIVKERKSKKNKNGERTLEILAIPVSEKVKQDFGERVTVTFSVDEDLILHITGKAATQDKNASVEIHDLRFGLKTQ